MIKAAAKGMVNILTKLRAGKKQVRFLNNTTVSPNCFFEGPGSIGENCRIMDCFVGQGSYTGRNTELVKVKIGRYCSIGSFVRNTIGRHPVTEFVSSHPAFFSKGKAAGFTFVNEQHFTELKFSEPSYFVTIGNDVWIGDNVLIQDGVTIGDGAIIGSNSLVTKNIEPYSVNVGSPSKIIKYRFDEELIKFLLDFKWWNKDIKWLREHSSQFASPATFKKIILALEDKSQKL